MIQYLGTLIDCLFGRNDPTKNSSDKYYVLLVEIKDLNVLINNKPFFDQPAKKNPQAYEKRFEMTRDYDFTT